MPAPARPSGLRLALARKVAHEEAPEVGLFALLQGSAAVSGSASSRPEAEAATAGPVVATAVARRLPPPTSEFLDGASPSFSSTLITFVLSPPVEGVGS